MVKNLDQNLPFVLHQAFGLAQQFGVLQMVKIQGDPPVSMYPFTVPWRFLEKQDAPREGKFWKTKLGSTPGEIGSKRTERSKKHGTNGALSGIKKNPLKTCQESQYEFCGLL
jgi:hypothetical protein